MGITPCPTSPSPLLPLLLSTLGRLYFEFLTRYLRSLRNLARTSAPSTQRYALSWRAFLGILDARNLPLDRFESFCVGINAHLKTAYHEAGWTDAQRMEAERGMLVRGKVPDVLVGVVVKCLGSGIERVVEGEGGKGDSVELMRLGFTTQESTTQTQLQGKRRRSGILSGIDKTRQGWDVIRKVPLYGVKSVRKCTRCGSLMENLQVEPGKVMEMPLWLVNVSKYCVCGGSWMVV